MTGTLARVAVWAVPPTPARGRVDSRRRAPRWHLLLSIVAAAAAIALDPAVVTAQCGGGCGSCGGGPAFFGSPGGAPSFFGSPCGSGCCGSRCGAPSCGGSRCGGPGCCGSPCGSPMPFLAARAADADAVADAAADSVAEAAPPVAGASGCRLRFCRAAVARPAVPVAVKAVDQVAAFRAGVPAVRVADWRAVPPVVAACPAVDRADRPAARRVHPADKSAARRCRPSMDRRARNLPRAIRAARRRSIRVRVRPPVRPRRSGSGRATFRRTIRKNSSVNSRRARSRRRVRSTCRRRRPIRWASSSGATSAKRPRPGSARMWPSPNPSEPPRVPRLPEPARAGISRNRASWPARTEWN